VSGAGLGTTQRKGAKSMRRLLCLGILLLAGCQLVGPRERREQTGRVDDPRLTLEEQERRARDRLSLPDQNLGPRTYMEYPGAGPTGR
jgi:hypothetical protein